MQFELQHDPRNITDDDLLSDLRRVAVAQAAQCLKQSTHKEPGQEQGATREPSCANAHLASQGLSSAGPSDSDVGGDSGGPWTGSGVPPRGGSGSGDPAREQRGDDGQEATIGILYKSVSIILHHEGQHERQTHPGGGTYPSRRGGQSRGPEGRGWRRCSRCRR